MFFGIIFGIQIIKRQVDYEPIYLPEDAVYIAENDDTQTLTLVVDDASIEFLIKDNIFNQTVPTSEQQVGISEIQTSEDQQLNTFLGWSSCGEGLFVDYFQN